MRFTADRTGKVFCENSFQDRFLEILYNHRTGRILLKPFLSPAVSKAGGILLDSPVSKIGIAPFIRSHAIDLREFETKNYRSYNDFFKRKMLPGKRNIEKEENILISPCDSRLSVYKISDHNVFSIKNTRYTVKSLLRNQKLAKLYDGGYIWIFRLSVEDYHRYIYVDNGKVSGNIRIPGIFHTVNPIANDHYPIYKENTREYSLLKSKNFGLLLQMEVGALLVGRIENKPGRKTVQRGEEKGNFAFGGSTVILMTQKNQVCPDKDILKYSLRGIETKVKLGERVGIKDLHRREKIV